MYRNVLDSATKLIAIFIVSVLSLVLASCGGGKSNSGVDSTPTVMLSCTPLSASEIDGTFTCVVNLSESTTTDVVVTVSYTGTAAAGTDYGGDTLLHTISAGSVSTSWTITGKSDSSTEGNEIIVINVESVTNATEDGKQQAILTLNDVDTRPTVTLSCPEKITENEAVYCELNLSKPGIDNVVITLSYSGTASRGPDYGGQSIRTIYAGKTSPPWDGRLKITSYMDNAVEGNETIVIDISSVTNATEDEIQQATLILEDVL